MCQKGSRREQRNERLLLLLAGILLLFSSFNGSSLPGCSARSLQVKYLDDGFGHGGRTRTRGLGDAHRSLLQEQPELAPAPGPSTPAESTGANQVTQNNGPSLSGDPSNSDNSPSASGEERLMWAFMVGPVAVVVFLVIFVAAVVRFCVQRRQTVSGTGWRKGISDNETEELEKTTYAGVPSNTFEELESACEEFTNVIINTSPDCTVFKGIRTSDGLQVAVTRIRTPSTSWTPKKEIGFRRKVEDLARMSHDNLVNLLAYCSSEKPFERMLVFEYATNGTLYEHLHGSLQGVGASDADHLDWATRMRIIMGAAYGLQYMHHELDPPASHFKFDASHVFLTENYSAKVADFGIAEGSVGMKSLGRRKSFKKIVRAIGYTDWDGYRTTPYLESNIRSFGVFLLETITGRPPYTETQGSLIDWAKDNLNDPERMWQLVDPSIEEFKEEELVAICEVVRLCIQPKASKQPNMREVSEMLSKALRMSPEVATSKSSPLLWAELELLGDSSIEVDPDAKLDSTAPGSPGGNQQLQKSGSSNKIPFPTPPFSHLELDPATIHHKVNTYPETTTDVPNVSRRPSLSLPKVVTSSGAHTRAASHNSSHRLWADNASELELLSPPDPGSAEDPEAPLAATLQKFSSSAATTLKKSQSLSGASQGSFSRGFRRVWTESAATELSKLDHLSPRGMSR